MKSCGQFSCAVVLAAAPSWALSGTVMCHFQPVWIERTLRNGASTVGHSQSLSTCWTMFVVTLTWRPWSYSTRPTVKTAAKTAEKSVIFTAFGVPNQAPCPSFERSM